MTTTTMQVRQFVARGRTYTARRVALLGYDRGTGSGWMIDEIPGRVYRHLRDIRSGLRGVQR